MEEGILFTVLRGCLMARELEANLPNIASQPNLLRASCEEIAAEFSIASNKLLNSNDAETITNFPTSEKKTEMVLNFPERFNFRGGGSGVAQPEEFSSSRTAAGSSVQRSSSRKSQLTRRTIKVSALLTENLEVPPDDGYTWRKFGQKDIIGARFPRSYYRCTHKSFYGCDAKKKVQRQNDNPSMYEVTYYGDHICNTIPTPPLLAFPTLSPPAAPPISHKRM